MLLKFLVDKNGFRCINPSDASSATLVNYIKCHFDFKDSAFSDVDAIVAVFKSATYNKISEVLLDSNNNCLIDSEVYKRGGTIQVTLIGDKYVDGQVISSSHTTVVSAFYINEGIIVPTVLPSKYDVFVAELEKAAQSVTDTIDRMTELVESGAFDGADGTGISSVAYNANGNVTVTLTDGTSFTSEYSMKGEKGDPGEDGNYISDIVYGQDGTVVITMSDGTQYVSDYSMKGEKGDQGEPGSKGDAFTYSDFTAEQLEALRGPKGDTGDTGATGATGAAGKGISSIMKTGTSGLVDTYTITYTDGTTSTYTVTNGRDGGGGIIKGTTATLTPTQVVDALTNGYNIELSYIDATYGAGKAYSFNYSDAMHEVVANVIFLYNADWIVCELHGNTVNNTWTMVSTIINTGSGGGVDVFELQVDWGSETVWDDYSSYYPMLTPYADILAAVNNGSLVCVIDRADNRRFCTYYQHNSDDSLRFEVICPYQYSPDVLNYVYYDIYYTDSGYGSLYESRMPLRNFDSMPYDIMGKFKIEFDGSSGRPVSTGIGYDVTTSFEDAYAAAVRGDLFYRADDDHILIYTDVNYWSSNGEGCVSGIGCSVDYDSSGTTPVLYVFYSRFDIYAVETSTDVSLVYDDEIVVPIYTAGTGISISNGVISLDLSQAEGGNY